jgi:large subunit ribosomal protein L29
MKIKDIQNLSDDELVAKEKQIKKDLFDLSNQRQLGRIEKPANVRNFRRDIARILTVLTERKNNGNKK